MQFGLASLFWLTAAAAIAVWSPRVFLAVVLAVVYLSIVAFLAMHFFKAIISLGNTSRLASKGRKHENHEDRAKNNFGDAFNNSE